MSESSANDNATLGNPLDSVEDFMLGNDWVFNRPAPDELAVSLTGRSGAYRLTFLWQEEFGALQFFCEYELRLPKDRQPAAATVLQKINERLWLGHFDLPETGAPCFRHTSLFRGWSHDEAGADQIADLVDIALAECERHFNTFNMLATLPSLDQDTLKLIMADEAGEA